MIRYYQGVRLGVGESRVEIHGDGAEGAYVEPLPLRLDVRKHSPTGFEWGYWGSGPSQLALALCIHALDAQARTGDPDASFPVERAQRVYHRVKERLIGPIQTDTWVITHEAVLAAIADAERETGPFEIETCERHPTRQYPAPSMGWRGGFCPDCREEERRLEEQEEEEERQRVARQVAEWEAHLKANPMKRVTDFTDFTEGEDAI